ncbi:MAG: SHOCT domain-containing protein [Candidatus Thermoplasmatota archaeon]|nr:SHOCT domain-containing protein [Candidatus Thermoplasmatota archaeon]
MNSPIDVLKMRFARGEVTKKEFEDMRKDLEG